MQTPSTLDYSELPPNGRIRYESNADGFTIILLPVGMWRRIWVGLIAMMFIMIIPIALLIVLIGPSRAFGLFATLWRTTLADLVWLAVSPLPLTFLAGCVIVLLKGFFEGKCQTTIIVGRGEVAVTLEGRFRTRQWRCSISECTPRHALGVLQLVKGTGFRFITIRCGRRSDLKWVYERLRNLTPLLAACAARYTCAMDTKVPPEAESDERSPISCPKCKAPMEKVKFQDIEVDRCTACKGLWFDMLEREHLDALVGSESIDVGPAHKEDRSQTVRINCPVCHTPMIRMVDLKNPEIWYESCKVCYGVFYDAGEFREHKEHHVFGFFRNLLNRKERK